jgi:PmbA protein
MSYTEDPVIERLLARAKAAGADAADAWVVERASLAASVRLGKLENVEREETRSASLRILIGKRQAAAAISDTRPEALDRLAERVAAMAKAAAEDPYCGLAPDERLAKTQPDLALHDPTSRTPEALEALAREAEDAGMAIAGISNSGGAGADWSAGRAAFGASNGFRGAYQTSSFGVGLSLIAERDGAKERDWESHDARFAADLESAQATGRTAGERTIARLGARKIASCTAPVIFDNRSSGRLIGAFAGAISGASVARGTSFLKDKLGQAVFAKGVTIVDDPAIPKGWGSRPFDGEGVAGARRALIEDGVLTGWLLNSAAARQLGLETSGNASPGIGSAPGMGPTNLTLLPGTKDLAGLMADAGAGLVVQEMFSPSYNPNTGDYSVGVSGFWFEGGARAYPVNEITVAGNLNDIFARLIPGSDLSGRSAVDAPSILIDGMAIAGL